VPGENIFLFAPNLISYAQIVFAIISFYFMLCCPLTASSFYLLSGLLDAFDGHAARVLNQGTGFGAMLDMRADCCSTMCLLVNLALLYPHATLLFQLNMSLDVASHWLHLHSSVVRGSESHKMIKLPGNPVRCIYYTSRLALFILGGPTHTGSAPGAPRELSEDGVLSHLLAQPWDLAWPETLGTLERGRWGRGQVSQKAGIQTSAPG
uniref:CDP-diacylglycerol--inositol 3-phosphatidyltransferase n=1 Tax=Balaenoptera musculus TaxID=9771 RepID=A0A8C0CC17_BALMU